MDKRQIYHIVEWVIALAACGWLIWEMATYDNYAALWESLRSMNYQHYIALLLCIALMPLNMSIEAWRWKTLIPMSWHEAHYQVYYSKLAGLITPWRLGEYPSRAILMASESRESSVESGESIWARVLSMGAVGSATMTMAIVAAGVVGLAFCPSVFDYLGGSYLYSLLAAVVILGVIFAITPRILKRWAEVNQDLMLRSIGQSLIRLACWCIQLYLVLFALNAISNIQYPIFNLPIYYLLVTITPNVPIAEAGVRGAWAIAVFGSMNAALAGVLLWVINTVLPCLIWPFLRKK